MTAATAPRAATEQPADWANLLAAAIIGDVHMLRYMAAEGVIAARLRLLKTQGEEEGLRKAVEAIASPLPSVAVLQRETQADYDQEREHGWSV